MRQRALVERTRTRGSALAVVCGAGLLLAACAGSTPAPEPAQPMATSRPRPQPVWHVVDEQSLSGNEASGATQGLDAVTIDGQAVLLAAGWQRTAAIAPTSGRLLRGTADGAWTREDLPANGPGTTLSGSAMVGPEPIVLGATSEAGHITPRAWRRHDGAWHETPAGSADHDRWWGDAAPTADGAALVVVHGRRDGSLDEAVGRFDGTGVTVAALPGTDGRTSLSSLATHDHLAVVIGAQHTAGGTIVRAWASADDGASWTEAPVGVLGPPGSTSVAGLVWHDGRFLAFGNDSAGAMQQWATADGTTWTTEAVTADGAPVDLRARAVTADDDVVLIAAVERSSWRPHLLRRDDGGDWVDAPYPRAWTDEVRMGTGPLIRFGGAAYVATVGSTGEAIMRSGARPAAWTRPEADSPAIHRWPINRSPDAIVATAAGWVLGGELGPLSSGYDGWTYDPLLWAGPAEHVHARPDLPDDLDSIAALTTAPDGRVVVLGLTSAEPTARPEGDDSTDYNDGWVGTLDDSGSIERRSTISGAGEQLPSGIVVQPEGAWAYGVTRARFDDPLDRPAIWSSPDLGAWTQQTVEGERGSVNDVCPTDAGAIAVGSLLDDAGVAHPAVWRLGADRGWQRVAGERDATKGWLSSCAARGDDVVAIGAIDDNPAVFTFDADGSMHDATIAIDPWVYPSSIRTIAGGFVAVGTDSSGGVARPALWTSIDGTTWNRSIVPDAVVDRDGVWVDDVAVAGGQVLVLVTDGARSRVWVVDGVADQLTR